MRRIGRYEILEQLGQGGAGAVFRARDPQLGRDVALKLLAARLDRDHQAVRRFGREARALAKLDHPGIVRCFEADQHRGQPYLAMELVEGESLAERLARGGPLEVEEAVELGRRLAAGLAHAHERGVLHRDIKPGNVLLDRLGRPRLTDFGLTRDLTSTSGSSLSKTGQLAGTPGYWAPEQAAGKQREIGPKSDVYGLGATIYAALTGVPPHGEAASLAEALQHSQTPPPSPSRRRAGIPPNLDRLVLDCLRVEPQERPSAAAVGQRLDELEEVVSRLSLSGSWLIAGGLGLCLTGLVLGLAAGGSSWSTPRSLASAPASPAVDPGRPPASVGRSAPAPSSQSIAEIPYESIVAEADEHAVAGRYQAALEAFDRALRHPEVERDVVQVQRARLLNQLGRFAESREVARSVLSLPDASPGARALALQVEAEELRLREDLDQALERCRQALALGSQHLALLMTTGLVYRDLDQRREALAFFERAVELYPDFGSAYLERGGLRRVVGELELAERDIARALELRPDLGPAYRERGLLREARGDFEGAVRDLSRCLELVPDDTRALSDRGAILCDKLNRPGEALTDFQRIRELEPGGDNVDFNVGVALARLDRHAEASPHFDAAIRRGERQALQFYMRGLTRLALGQLEGARADLTRSAALAAQTEQGKAAYGGPLIQAFGRLEAAEAARAEAESSPQ